jgi:hypothetical protein
MYDAVKAGQVINQSAATFRDDLSLLWDCFPTATPPVSDAARYARWAWGGSVEAALELIAATLPDYIAEMDTTGFARIWKDDFEATHTFSELVPGKPATALLLACVAALIAEEERK